MSDHRYIKFYSTHDLSSGISLQRTEVIFNHWNEYVNSADINIILELYNIKKLFDTGIHLIQWDDEQYHAYLNKCQTIPKILGKFCATISDINLAVFYKATDCIYIDDFWELICIYKVYQHITSTVLGELLNMGEHIVWYVLRHKELVKKFGEVIAEHLSHNSFTAQHLISRYLVLHERNNYALIFPDEFTQDMRNKTLIEYIERDNASINILQLLAQAQSSQEFPLSDKLRLKAQKRVDILKKTFFLNNPKISYGAEVTFKSIPDDIVESSFKNNIMSYAYSRKWIKENQDYSTLLNNFIYLFEYVDRCFRCNFVSLQNDLTLFEKFGTKGKKDYTTGIIFNSKRILTLAQMAAYNKELQQIGIQLEDIFKWFFEYYLKNEFDATGFKYEPPSTATTLVEKCKLLCISIDGILKQYRLYCEDGTVDRELLEISSGHIVFNELSGMLQNKYAYPISDNIRNEMFLLFSDQSMLSYTEKTCDKYQTLPQLLISEKIKREDFSKYQYEELDWLIERSDLFISENGFLTINKDRVFILKDLFENEVICPIYYTQELREQVDHLVTAGDLCYKNTLFSKPEQDYLNYILNKAEFSNGLDLRNRYSHDTCTLNEEIQRRDYLELQKIMVLIIIKINEELCIKY